MVIREAVIVDSLACVVDHGETAAVTVPAGPEIEEKDPDENTTFRCSA